eukprot:GHRR01025087.1.p1 GENE.GHRR01025087.1~~GHRR01025087.1.p1  ORF type:complete len:145 (+),score=24.68 GHRR01025087.1:216-650(+)
MRALHVPKAVGLSAHCSTLFYETCLWSPQHAAPDDHMHSVLCLIMVSSFAAGNKLCYGMLLIHCIHWTSAVPMLVLHAQSTGSIVAATLLDTCDIVAMPASTCTLYVCRACCCVDGNGWLFTTAVSSGSSFVMPQLLACLQQFL